MKTNLVFDEHEVLHDLKHYLPAQASLKDFIHHNTLHAFQKLKFFDALREASEKLGYNVTLTIDNYRTLYKQGKISEAVLDRVIATHKGSEQALWKKKLTDYEFSAPALPRIGAVRANWKKEYRIDLDSLVHPILFRILCSYIDQGIAIWQFPIWHKGFLESIKEMERVSLSSFFRTSRARKMLVDGNHKISDLLKILIGDTSLYKQYLFDQQFAHQGWSGMISTIEDQPETLLDRRNVTLHDLVTFELLLEIDALDSLFGENWSPLSLRLRNKPVDLFAEVVPTELAEAISLWQEAFEWTYYDQVLGGMRSIQHNNGKQMEKTFAVMFCIDDRECSLRRYLEKTDTACETYGTPGFFSVEFYFQPINGKFYTKLCPAPVTPKYLIKEVGTGKKQEKDAHFTKQSHSLFRGWFIAQTLGFWSAFKLFVNIFKPSMGPATASSLKHMDRDAKLTIENKSLDDRENNLQIGFTKDEMVARVESLLKSIGMVKDFAPIVYVIGHGSSSVNNPHFAAYDCGACSGRAGSVNSRVVSYMANLPEVRAALAEKGVTIPVETQFVGGLHDTTRDQIVFFDEDVLTSKNTEGHKRNLSTFDQALDLNSKERSRRFESIDTHLSPKKIHEKVLDRSVSLFEPRPELNHATNTLCIVGRRSLTKHLFLDRRSFLNSYDYQIDLEGQLLYGIMRPLGPVCGGINLEYFFSRVDNQKMGAGTKLPHNVMGLVGVANGIDGDLRPGLPVQMIEVHDPVRLLIIVEHFPDVVLKTIQKAPEVYEWFINEWVHLVAVNPETYEFSYFNKGTFVPYRPLKEKVEQIADITPILEKEQENIPVYAIS